MTSVSNYEKYDPKWFDRVAGFDRMGIKHCPCKFCGAPAQGGFHEPPASGQCDGCWEVTHRLPDFLRQGTAARNFVSSLLDAR